MDIERLKRKQYSVYTNLIDIELFNKIITFMASTNTKQEAWAIFRKLEDKCIWLNKTNNLTLQDEYGFKYFGELLERYEERIGNDIKITRAIALAMGYGSKLIENNMIVDTQLVDFISKVKALAQNDIYLKGALYLYNSEKYATYAEELMNKNYESSEEIIFALSCFYERIEEFFNLNKNQLIKLVGILKTIETIGNAGVYAWLIRNLYKLIVKDRKKDIALLKALIKIPTEVIIDEIMPSKNTNINLYQELMDNGYSKEEIIYLNYVLLYFNTVPKSIILGKSVVEEKIATNFCKIMINSKKSYTDDDYNLISNVLLKYEKYYIKCYGYYKIMEVLQNELNVVNPITFSVLYYDLYKKLYSFNILDEKWDIVAKSAGDIKYQEIFDQFLLENKFDNKTCKECIEKYNKLTEKEYIKSFLDYKYTRKEVFKLLVDNNVIILKNIFEEIIQNNIPSNENHLEKYIDGVNNKKSFELLKYLLRLNKYSIKEISSFGFNFDSLARCYRYSSEDRIYDLDFERKFLNKKEQIILFNCVDKYIFYNKPEYYFSFLEQVFKNDMILKIFEKRELRKMYLALCEIYPKEYNTKWLQQKYLTEEEFNNICEQEKLAKKQEELKKIQEAEQAVKNQFNEIKDKNSLKCLFNFCDRYKYNSEKIPFCMKLAKESILNYGTVLSKEQSEVNAFVELLNLFIYEEALTPSEFTKLVYEYIKEEVKDNESINAAY